MKLFKAILVGGLVAGALDITYAFVVYGPLSYQMTPVQILHSVAAGWVGHDAADAWGAMMAVLGLATHFAMTTAMAAAFVYAAQRLPALNANPVIAGLAYGLGLYVVMTYVVLPPSAAHPSQQFWARWDQVISRPP